MTDQPRALRKQHEFRIVKSLVEAARQYMALQNQAILVGVDADLLIAAEKRLMLATKKAVRIWEISQ